jgi:hypothetical protein
MNEGLQTQIESYLERLRGLIRRGRRLQEQLELNPAGVSATAATRLWQEECGITINQLSGGSKAHWLARAFSEAFLMRSAGGQAVERVAPDQIVRRLVQVLERAVSSLTQTSDELIVSSSGSSEPAPRRFDFVHDADLRPVVEQAYNDGRRALERGDYGLALRTSCGILEAIVTDALEHKGLSALAEFGAPAGPIADWDFATRLAIAEKAGLIRGGCARLPDVARRYRDFGADGDGISVSEGDARRAGQVLHVVMRDLNPGR